RRTLRLRLNLPRTLLTRPNRPILQHLALPMPPPARRICLLPAALVLSDLSRDVSPRIGYNFSAPPRLLLHPFLTGGIS
ncbi:MAG TPA: hypothetical protein VJ255_04735, partial [Candidatus Acidoferrum sp.]|nr:hypothetical protein [Candidatus Acidoferrum sp.]